MPKPAPLPGLVRRQRWHDGQTVMLLGAADFACLQVWIRQIGSDPGEISKVEVDEHGNTRLHYPFDPAVRRESVLIPGSKARPVPDIPWCEDRTLR